MTAPGLQICPLARAAAPPAESQATTPWRNWLGTADLAHQSLAFCCKRQVGATKQFLASSWLQGVYQCKGCLAGEAVQK
ncbi:hypothetical protein Pelo_19808 [Pelomyxa schiedti]|nr:hypothetical protein Pelo_19808 [Pelomyxa schiedti]